MLSGRRRPGAWPAAGRGLLAAGRRVTDGGLLLVWPRPSGLAMNGWPSDLLRPAWR